MHVQNKELGEKLAEAQGTLQNTTQKVKEQLTKKKVELAEAREKLREEEAHCERKNGSFEDLRIELIRKEEVIAKNKS